MSNRTDNYLYVLVAASTVGKNALINKMMEERLWLPVSKYSTRDYRPGVGDDVVLIDDSEVIRVEKTGVKSDIRAARMKYIQKICGNNKGIVYYKNNNFYGICYDEILKGLECNNLAVIISDFHVIEKLRNKEELKDKIKVLYIASSIDEREILRRYKIREATSFNEESEETLKTINSIQNMCSILSSAARLKYLTKIEAVLPLLNEQWNNYLPYFETIKTRSLNIRMLYNRYIDKIAYIDYPILNFYDLEYMYQQVRNIINFKSTVKNCCQPPIFMVCAAPSSGKKTLMEIVGDLGVVNQNIIVVKKYAKRNIRLTDGRDGMVAIGKDGQFEDYITNSDNIWRWSFHNGATEYAVDRSEIDSNIKKGMAQIFISNMEQIDVAKQYYPNNIVILYLHATHESATKSHITEKRKNEIIDMLKEQKEFEFSEDAITEIFKSDGKWKKMLKELTRNDLGEIRDIHNAFVVHNANINHVLLNTGTREDMVEQMINLINHYSTLQASI